MGIFPIGIPIGILSEILIGIACDINYLRRESVATCRKS
jgi:hypothetical protein